MILADTLPGLGSPPGRTRYMLTAEEAEYMERLRAEQKAMQARDTHFKQTILAILYRRPVSTTGIQRRLRQGQLPAINREKLQALLAELEAEGHVIRQHGRWRRN